MSKTDRLDLLRERLPGWSFEVAWLEDTGIWNVHCWKGAAAGADVWCFASGPDLNEACREAIEKSKDAKPITGWADVKKALHI